MIIQIARKGSFIIPTLVSNQQFSVWKGPVYKYIKSQPNKITLLSPFVLYYSTLTEAFWHAVRNDYKKGHLGFQFITVIYY